MFVKHRWPQQQQSLKKIFLVLVWFSWLLNATFNNISVIFVTAHRWAGSLKKKVDQRSGSQCHRHFVRFFKDLSNTNLRKFFVIQMPWNLSGIYNKVYSLVLANKIDSPREYFRVLLLQSGVPKCYIDVEYLVSSRKLTATCGIRNSLWNIKVPICRV